jgi:hypothetical protein
MSTEPIERRLWWAGWLIAIGLAVEVAVSRWVHPFAFVTFAVVACPLVLAGMLLFLWSVVASGGRGAA